MTAHELQRAMHALRENALTVCASREPHMQQAVIDAFARRGLRAWIAGSGNVVALDAEESLALDRLEVQQARADERARAVEGFRRMMADVFGASAQRMSA